MRAFEAPRSVDRPDQIRRDGKRRGFEDLARQLRIHKRSIGVATPAPWAALVLGEVLLGGLLCFIHDFLLLLARLKMLVGRSRLKRCGLSSWTCGHTTHPNLFSSTLSFCALHARDATPVLP